MPRIVPSSLDPVVALVVAIVMMAAVLLVVSTARSAHEKVSRILFLYLTYIVLEIIFKRAAHYTVYLYPVKYGLFFLMMAVWLTSRRKLDASSSPAPLRPLIGAYLFLAAVQVFNPYQATPIVGALGWLSDFIYVPLYFLAFDLFHDVATVRRLLAVTAGLALLSAAGCLLEQAIGPDALMAQYPTYVRLGFFSPSGLRYRPSSLSPFVETFGMLAMVGLLATRRAPVTLMIGAIAVCSIANLLHAIRIVWATGLLALGLFVLLTRTRSMKTLLIVLGCITIAVHLAVDLSDGLIEASLASATTPLDTLQRNRLGGWTALPGIVSAFPFGVGVGESSAGLRLVDSSDVITFGVHNYVVELAAQMSVLGPMLLLAFCVGLFGIGVRRIGYGHLDERRVQLAVWLAVFGAVAVSFFGGGALGASPQNEYFWLAAGTAGRLAVQAAADRASTRSIRLSLSSRGRPLAPASDLQPQ
jgi:hypothetical protein